MTDRRVHLVGTLGQPDVPTSMSLAVRTVGKYLSTIPDGEPGDQDDPDGRADWITTQVNRLGTQPGVKTIKRPRLDKNPMRIRDGAIYAGNITQETLALPYARHAVAAVPVLRDLVHASGYSYRLQVDIPGPLDLATMCHGPLTYQYYETHVAAAAWEVNAVSSLNGMQPVFQLSLPVETWLVAMAPARLRSRVANRLARRLAEFVSRTVAGTEWIVHLCVGDPHGKPLVTLRNMDALVELTNAIWRHWPAGHQLNAVHLPVGDGTNPVRPDPKYYVPMYRLEVPTSIHVSLGLAHLGADLIDQQISLCEAERASGRVLGVSTSCGLGRRAGRAEDSLLRMAALAES